jgi:hypothetical protein
MASAKNSVLNGVLVRSFIQARPVPTTSESTRRRRRTAAS